MSIRGGWILLQLGLYEQLLASEHKSRDSRESSHHPIQMRDAFQYLRVSQDDGTEQNFSLSDDSTPGIQNLVHWVSQESDRIWAQRATSRPQ
jgi:hypothetical protein